MENLGKSGKEFRVLLLSTVERYYRVMDKEGM
jgi:hypothetical protein